LVNTESQFSCIRRDLMQALVDIGVKAKKGSFQLCHLAIAIRCDVNQTVQFRFLLGSFSWNFQFKMLKRGTFGILGSYFVSHYNMVMDMKDRKYYIRFVPY